MMQNVPQNADIITNSGSPTIETQEGAHNSNSNPKEEYNLYLIRNAQVLIKNKEFRLAHNLLQAVLQQEPSNVLALLGLGQVFEQQEMFNKAEEVYRYLANIDPRPKNNLFLANNLYSQEKYEEAKNIYEKLQPITNELSSENIFFINKNLGNCFAQLNEFSKAEGCYQKALEIHPHNDGILVNLGIVYLNQGNLDSADQLFSQARQKNPNNDKAICGMGILFLNREQYENANHLFAQALNLNPENLTALFYMIKLAHQNNEYQVVTHHLLNYLKNHPHDCNILYSLAGVYYKQKDFENTLKIVHKILEINPAHEKAIELKGLI